METNLPAKLVFITDELRRLGFYTSC